MIQFECKDGNLIVYLEGELTYENTNGIKEEIKAHISENTKKVILELANLDLIDSSGVGVFISILRRMNGDGVYLAAPQSKIARILEITKLNQIIPVCNTVDEAILK